MAARTALWSDTNPGSRMRIADLHPAIGRAYEPSLTPANR